jgi:hypothetical protein
MVGQYDTEKVPLQVHNSGMAFCHLQIVRQEKRRRGEWELCG